MAKQEFGFVVESVAVVFHIGCEAPMSWLSDDPDRLARLIAQDEQLRQKAAEDRIKRMREARAVRGVIKTPKLALGYA